MKFKVDDKVKVLKGVLKGEIGTVTEVKQYDLYPYRVHITGCPYHFHRLGRPFDDDEIEKSIPIGEQLTFNWA